MNQLNPPPTIRTIFLQDDPKLWYGIGILYDRYGSLDHAEEAFASVLRMNKGMCLFQGKYTRSYPTPHRFRLRQVQRDPLSIGYNL